MSKRQIEMAVPLTLPRPSAVEGLLEESSLVQDMGTSLGGCLVYVYIYIYIHIYIYVYIYILVGGSEHGFYVSHHIGNVIIPTDELIFFRGVAQPPSRKNSFIIHIQLMFICILV